MVCGGGVSVENEIGWFVGVGDLFVLLVGWVKGYIKLCLFVCFFSFFVNGFLCYLSQNLCSLPPPPPPTSSSLTL